MNFRLAGIFLLCCLWSSSLFSQVKNSTNPTAIISRQGLWNCKFADGNFYSVSLGAIDSVSQHDYFLDGSLHVTEVTVATRGSTQARFYTIEKPGMDAAGPAKSAMDKVGQIADEIASRAPGDGKKAALGVVKKFPETSHAKIIEYRISNQEELAKLFQHLLSRWQGRSAEDTYEVKD